MKYIALLLGIAALGLSSCVQRPVFALNNNGFFHGSNEGPYNYYDRPSHGLSYGSGYGSGTSGTHQTY